MPKVFIVEDDENIRELVIYALKSNGFEAEGFETGRDFFNALNKTEEMPALILLDIMLPEMDGYEILRRVRESERVFPVIILSAKSSEFDKVKGLNVGADDYITKPFGVMELISRINAVLRRSGAKSGSPADKNIEYKNIIIDKERRAVFADGEKITLTYKEYELLHYLILNTEIVVSRDKIMDAVWGYDFEGASRTVDMHIKTLRQKLGAAGGHIKTIRNVGYKIGE